MTLWEKMLVDIEREFENKENFLKHDTISRTIAPKDRNNPHSITRKFLDHAKRDVNCANNILPKVLELPIGGLLLTDGYSQGTAQHCFYLNVMFKHLKLEITDFDHITDVGGGYGNFYRMANKLGYRGTFDIVDFPIMHKIQEHYLTELELDLPNFIEMEKISPKGKSILFGLHSINEMPISDRDFLEEKYRLYDNIMILYNDHFDGINNFEYFAKLKDRLSDTFNVSIIDHELKGNAKFLMGSKVV